MVARATKFEFPSKPQNEIWKLSGVLPFLCSEKPTVPEDQHRLAHLTFSRGNAKWNLEMLEYGMLAFDILKIGNLKNENPTLGNLKIESFEIWIFQNWKFVNWNF